MFKTKRLLARIARLEAENKDLKSRLQCKTDSLMYVNSLLSKRTQEVIKYKRVIDTLYGVQGLDFPNSEDPNQISIHDILEH